MVATREQVHPAEQYIADVQAGHVTVGRWVRLAVERHCRDLKTGAERGLQFDRAAAERAVKYFSFLTHTKGEWAGKAVHLEPWECFIIWCVFGWMRKDSEGRMVRRFRMAYVKVARKNGKSTFAAGVGLYLFMADGEPGAEVYSAATKKDQALIVHAEAVAMVKRSAPLSGRVQVYKNNLNISATRSRFEPLGADSNTLDGLNVHGAIVDELHAHPNRGVLDVLDSATGARRQPLLFIITTAGVDNVGPDHDMTRYSEDILNGTVEDDRFFTIVYAVDEKDRWDDEACWVKANPNLGVSVKIDDLRAKATKAKAMPTALNEFLCKHLNRSVKQVTRWIAPDAWAACKGEMPDLTGRTCYVGLDLSSKLDVSAAAFVFPPEGEDMRWRAFVKLFVPEQTALTREKMARVPYATWGKQGFIHLTPGNVIDYDFIKAEIFAAAKVYQIAEVAYDPWNATQIALQLQAEDLAVVEVQQGYRSLSEPTKELEKLIASTSLIHDGNAALTWMAGNVAIETDPAGNIKPSKRHSAEKIDGIAAMVTAMARAMLSAASEPSVYETRGLQFV